MNKTIKLTEMSHLNDLKKRELCAIKGGTDINECDAVDYECEIFDAALPTCGCCTTGKQFRKNRQGQNVIDDILSIDCLS